MGQPNITATVHRASRSAPGATVDFLAGNVKRAPKVFSENGLEWFYRFVKEPKRLFRRYFVDDMQIFCLAWKYRKEQQ